MGHAQLSIPNAYIPLHPHKITRAELLKPLTEMDFLLLIAGFFCFSYGFVAIIDYLPNQALSAGMSADLVQYLLPILNAGSLFGRLSAGVIRQSCRTTRPRAMLLSSITLSFSGH